MTTGAEFKSDDLTLTITWKLRTEWGAEGLLVRAARHALVASGVRQGALSIVVVGDRAMRRLHREYMQIDKPTDVLTFDLRDRPEAQTVDGEIVVCADVARRIARRRQGPKGDVSAELALYIVHGVLHLVGYDDHDPDEAARMHTRENELLSELGLGAVFGAVDE